MKKEIQTFIINTWTITKKDLRSHFDNPTAYIVIVAFLLLSEFLFFNQAFLMGEASLRAFFVLLPWLFLLLIPAITMGSISQERSEGTIEYLLTKPVRELEFLAGKFVSSLIFVTLTLVLIIPIAITFANFGDFDWGAFFAQFVASIFLAAVFISLGIAISSLFSSQISSFIVTAIASLLLNIIGFELVTSSLPHSVALVAERLSTIAHFESMARGVLDMRDIWYLISVVAIFMALAYMKMIKTKYGNSAKIYRGYKIGIFLFIGIAVFSNIVGSRIPGRMDFTEDKIYTLTDATKDSLRELDDVVTINLYVSKELPVQFQSVIRDVKDMLEDYRDTAGSNIILNYKDPEDGEEVEDEIEKYGIKEMQFNVRQKEEFQVKRGRMGLAVVYGVEFEAIPFIGGTADLEYQLTSIIEKLKNDEKKLVRFVYGNGEKKILEKYNIMEQALLNQFDVLPTLINSSSPDIEEGVSLLVFPGTNKQVPDEVLENIKEYIDAGGSAMFLTEGIKVDDVLGRATRNETNFINWIYDNFGVRIENNLIYDLSSNETVRFGQGFGSYFLPYPMWLRALPLDSSPVTAKIGFAIMPWASGLTINQEILDKSGYEVIKLLGTTEQAGVQIEGAINTKPEQQYSQENLGVKTVMVALKPKDPESNKGMIVIAGDTEFIQDNYIANSPENSALGLELVSWLTQQRSLATIQLKQQKNRQLVFSNPSEQRKIKWAHFAVALFLPASIGMLRGQRRRKLKQKKYQFKNK